MVAGALSLGMTSIAAVQQISQGNFVKRESGVKVIHVLKLPPVSMFKQDMCVSTLTCLCVDKILRVHSLHTGFLVCTAARTIKTCYKKEAEGAAQVHPPAGSICFMDLPPGSDRSQVVLKGVFFCDFDLIREAPVCFPGVAAYLLLIAAQGHDPAFCNVQPFQLFH